MKNSGGLADSAAFWALLLTVLGAVSGYFTAGRGGHTPPATMALIGAIWGGFIGVLFAMEISHVELPKRRVAGASLGLLASILCGVLLGWHFPSIAAVGLLAAVLGVFADRWVKHVSLPL
jgi:hypothetical protein